MGLLEIFIVIVLLGWVFGAFIVPVGGAFIHLLLVVAVVLILARMLNGRNVDL